MPIAPCKYCRVVPVVSDVGGNKPYYEIGCNCKNGMVIGSYDKEEVCTCWNILNERECNNG